MQYALIFYDLQLILAPMAVTPRPGQRRRLVCAAARWRLLGCLIMHSTLRWGKPATWGRSMTEGRRPHRTLLPDTVGSDHQKPTSLQGIANNATTDEQPRVRDLDGCLDADLLLACWRDLNQQAASGVEGLGCARPRRPIYRPTSRHWSTVSTRTATGPHGSGAVIFRRKTALKGRSGCLHAQTHWCNGPVRSA